MELLEHFPYSEWVLIFLERQEILATKVVQNLLVYTIGNHNLYKC
jgi:hypothetical protein